METDLIIYVLIGFGAQLIDSALGMAFGSLSSGLLMTMGFPPQAISATVHMAEIFGGSASAISHWRMKNIDWNLLKKLAIPAIIGALLGTLLVTQFNNEVLKPILGIYFLLIGMVVILKVLRPSFIRNINAHRPTLGFFGGFLDSFGGAGWGEFVSSGLLLRGQKTRSTIGSVVTVEFLVAVTVSIVFYTTIGIELWSAVIALAIGAIIAAPFGAWACKKAPVVPLTLIVGLLISGMGIKAIIASFLN